MEFSKNLEVFLRVPVSFRFPSDLGRRLFLESCSRTPMQRWSRLNACDLRLWSAVRSSNLACSSVINSLKYYEKGKNEIVFLIKLIIIFKYWNQLHRLRYLECWSLSSRSCIDSLIARTSSTRPSCGISAQRSMWGLVFLFSNLVSASFNGFRLASKAISSSLVVASCSSNSSFV